MINSAETTIARSAYCREALSFRGNLGDANGEVRLERTESAPIDRPSITPYVSVDEVVYSSQRPWPEGIAGTDNSLQRVSTSRIGNLASNWFANAAASGNVDFVLALAGDTNRDGRFDRADINQIL